MLEKNVFAFSKASVWLWTRPLQLSPLNLAVVASVFSRITQNESINIITSACFRNPLSLSLLSNASHSLNTSMLWKRHNSHLPCVSTRLILRYPLCIPAPWNPVSEPHWHISPVRFSLLPYLTWLLVVSRAAPHLVLQCPGLSSCNAVMFCCIFFLFLTVFFLSFHFILLIETGFSRGRGITQEKTCVSCVPTWYHWFLLLVLSIWLVTLYQQLASCCQWVNQPEPVSALTCNPKNGY